MRALLAWTAALAATALAGRAEAKYSFQGLISLSGGWTDNATGATVDQAQGQQGDWFALVSPSVVFTSALPRIVQRVSYNFSAQVYANHPDLASLSNRLDWIAMATPTPTTELLVGAYAQQSQLNTVSALPVDSGTSGLQVTVPGTEQFFGAGVNQTLGWSFSPAGRLNQSAAFSTFIPLAQGLGQTYDGNGSLGLERLFRKDAFGADLRLDYIYFGEQRGPVTNPDGTVNPNGLVRTSQQQLLSTLLGRWRRDYGYFWNSTLTAGVTMAMRANDGGGQIWQPTGSAAIRYLHPKVQLDLSYEHAVAPSAIVQATFASDTVSSHIGVPFGIKSKLSALAGGGYSHSVSLDLNRGTTGGALDLIFVDATLTWTPFDGVSIYARYTFNDQIGSVGGAPSYQRNLIMAGLSIIYPTTAAAVVPSRSALRVDRSDSEGVPALHAPSPAEGAPPPDAPAQ